MIWGLVNQGMSCSKCNLCAHWDCAKKEACPKDPPKDSTEQPQNVAQVKIQPKPSVADVTRAVIGEIMTPVKKILPDEPFSMISTPKVVVNFVHIAGPLIFARETAIKAANWVNWQLSWGVYFGFLFVLQFPKLFIPIPLIAFIYIAVLNLRRKSLYLEASAAGKMEIAMKDIVDWEKKRSIDFKKNMNGVQEITADYVIMHGELMTFLGKLSWKDEILSRGILKCLVAALIACLFSLYYFPLKFLIFFSVTGLFFSKHPVVKSVLNEKRSRKTFYWIANEKFTTFLIHLIFGAKSPKKNFAEAYENERWWVGVGWSAPLVTERAHFSNEDGSLTMNKESFKLPKQFEWVGEWVVDRSPNTDPDGWEYGDGSYSNFVNTRTWDSFTRRRRWIRCYDFVSPQKKEQKHGHGLTTEPIQNDSSPYTITWLFRRLKYSI